MAQRIGARGLLIKAADGVDPWPQCAGAAASARAVGLEAVPWSYCYGDPAEIDTLLDLGEPIICIDPEAHFEAASPEMRRWFVERLREAHAAGTRVWSCVEARSEYHANIPYADLAAVSEAVVPMQAWQVWQPRDCSAWFDRWDARGYAGFPWLPAGDVTPDELVRSVGEAQRRYGGASIWAADILSSEQIDALAVIRAAT